MQKSEGSPRDFGVVPRHIGDLQLHSRPIPAIVRLIFITSARLSRLSSVVVLTRILQNDHVQISHLAVVRVSEIAPIELPLLNRQSIAIMIAILGQHCCALLCGLQLLAVSR